MARPSSSTSATSESIIDDMDWLVNELTSAENGVISLNERNLWMADRVKELFCGEQHTNMIRPI